MCLIHSVGNCAHGSRHVGHAGVQNLLPRLRFPPPSNRFKEKRLLKSGGFRFFWGESTVWKWSIWRRWRGCSSVVDSTMIVRFCDH